jgi:hypothetical protein
MVALSAEKIFTLLKDEAWHSVAELSEKTEVEANKLVKYSQFLARKGIVQYDDQNLRVKVEREWRRLLPDETELIEPRSSVANFIIPGKTSVVVQSTRISNLSSIDLEVTLRIKDRIREVAVNI